ncbi:hypothetical protein [Thiofilum flexile]|uniref:hypothetical protein n=1 Tax=Thiofilum flexile TaxID=125627 RepID=UPI00036C7683|nr:hypothetical protein [Thiofilum flexile]
MCTLMQKDVMIEALSQYIAGNRHLAEGQPSLALDQELDTLLQYRTYLYMTDPSELERAQWWQWSEPYHVKYLGTPRLQTVATQGQVAS